MSTSLPIANLPFLYANNCVGTWISNTTCIVNAGQVRDSTNTFDIVIGSTLTINGAVNGANGLDTGSLANNTLYGVYVCFDPGGFITPCALLSASLTTPTLPTVRGVTYSAFRLVDYQFTNGSAQLLKVYNVGNGSARYKEYDAPIIVLNNGSATSFTAVSLGVAGVPASNFGRVKIQAVYVPHAASETASVQTYGGTGTQFPMTGIVASVSQSDFIDPIPALNSGVPSVSYKVDVATSPASLKLYVVGYEYFL